MNIVRDGGSGDTNTETRGKFTPHGRTFKFFDPGISKGRLDRSDDPSPGADIRLSSPPVDNGGDPTEPLEIFPYTYSVLSGCAGGELVPCSAAPSVTGG